MASGRKDSTNWKLENLHGPMAFIADLHGNLAALEAVLAAMKDDHATTLFVAGDLLLEGDDPLGVWLRLMEVNARCVRGTSDRALGSIDPAKLRPRSDDEAAAGQRFAATRAALGDLILAKLRKLPEALRLEMPDGREWLVVHGSPLDPDEQITFDLDDDELNALIADDPADVVICGGAHTPFVRSLEGVTVVALGSAGAAPAGRVAYYTLMAPTPGGPRIEQRSIEY